jgi:hypothetical protein
MTVGERVGGISIKKVKSPAIALHTEVSKNSNNPHSLHDGWRVGEEVKSRDQTSAPRTNSSNGAVAD